MGSNRIHNADLFTQSANEQFQHHIKTQSKKALLMLLQLVDWHRLMRPLEARLERHRKKHSPAGRKSFPLIVIVRCFLLQKLYNLSDPRLEEEIADRRSFQIFLGLTSGDAIPDETTICRYRELFSRLGLDRLLFESFNAQLRQEGIILNKGTLVDATILPAQATPQSGRDKDAKSTQKHGKQYYGSKGHIGMDEQTNIIKKTSFTPANVHDSRVFDDLVDYSEGAVFADKAYYSERRSKELEAQGVFDGILTRGRRNKPLTNTEQKINSMLSKVRNAVERPFAFMKRILNYRRCSYYDLGRNRFEFNIACLVYNMRTYLGIVT